MLTTVSSGVSATPAPRSPSCDWRLVLGAFVLGWAALNAAIVLLAHGFLPFDRPALAGTPFAWQVAMPSIAMIEQLALMGLVVALNAGRDVTPRRALLPPVATARAELALLAAWALGAQAGGWLLARRLGMRPFSFHLAGSMVGCAVPPTVTEALTWAGYNFTAFVVIPLAWFGPKYGLGGLWLRFDQAKTGIGRDLLTTLVVLVVEGVVQIVAIPGAFATPAHVWLLAAPLTLVLSLLGTVLPTMVLVAALIVPRLWRVTGSVAAATVLGGLTYAAMHLVEGWSSFGSPRYALLSVLFVFLSYTGPGMFKSFVTLRTGNAWVHALGYHLIAPHTLFDTALIAKVFGLR